MVTDKEQKKNIQYYKKCIYSMLLLLFAKIHKLPVMIILWCQCHFHYCALLKRGSAYILSSLYFNVSQWICWIYHHVFLLLSIYLSRKTSPQWATLRSVLSWFLWPCLSWAPVQSHGSLWLSCSPRGPAQQLWLWQAAATGHPTFL